MKFCLVCQNMLYINIKEEDDTLNYYCRNCDYNEDCHTSVCISSSSDVMKNANSYRNVINKYTKHDPTLPRVNNISCPNAECETNKDKEDASEKVEKEVIYFRYDSRNMKYLYLCCVCDVSWVIDDKQNI
jgi:DNA-directed RNA polymerase II subunit RPB9